MPQTEEAEAPQPQKKPSRDRWAKLLMAAVLVAAVVAIYLFQIRPPKPHGQWLSDLDAALKRGREEDRPVLALFTGRRMNSTTAWVVRNCLNHPIVDTARERYKPLCVLVRADEGSELITKHGVEVLPTVVVYTPNGQVVGREEGRVGPDAVRGLLAKAAGGREDQP